MYGVPRIHPAVGAVKTERNTVTIPSKPATLTAPIAVPPTGKSHCFLPRTGNGFLFTTTPSGIQKVPKSTRLDTQSFFPVLWWEFREARQVAPKVALGAAGRRPR